MKTFNWLIPGLSLIVTVAIGLMVLTPYVFASRITPLVSLRSQVLTGIAPADLDGVVARIGEEFGKEQIVVRLQNQEERITLNNIGVQYDVIATTNKVKESLAAYSLPLGVRDIPPVIVINPDTLRTYIQGTIASQLELPKNASLVIAANNTLTLVPGQAGAGIDYATLQQDIREELQNPTPSPITLNVIPADPEVGSGEVEGARKLATELLTEGMKLINGDQVYEVKPFTIKRLIRFVEQDDQYNENNKVLGVALDTPGLIEYLGTTLEKEINIPPQNARFELVDGTVKQFILPQKGRQLDKEASAQAMNEQLVKGIREVALAISIQEPEINELANMQSLGITELLARGESDFQGSPKNRIKNITEGTSRYHGLLIAPGAEFSFNQFLGPVDGAHGFAPELVIKNHVTTPEFGGGLCQVSTTVFRAAVESGMKITARRNHAYAVRYYGTPGFDATIYPPYTDFRFLNNTPAYILIQTKIDGTKLAFEFWGTKDGRQVVIEGPTPYQRQSNGAVKAVLKQTVIKDNQTMLEDTFYSNYKSPALFPKVVAADT